jgi:thioredoxin reductase
VKQIEKYDSAELRKEKIVNVNKEEDGIFVITDDNEKSIRAKKVVLAVGYHRHPRFRRMLGRYDRLKRRFIHAISLAESTSVWPILSDSLYHLLLCLQ